jgi:peptidoglycan/LPS O-acetylase OafA/YrhL
MFACYFGLHEAGMLPYFAVIVVAAHLIAFASWHLVEKPAMSLKDWVPPRPAVRGRQDAEPDPEDAVIPTPVPAMAGASTHDS